MKIFLSEAPADYSTYTFPYALYASMKAGDDLNEVYSRGFLPYSVPEYIPSDKILFYLARSIRIDLNAFTLSAENRRVRRKMQELNPVVKIKEKDEVPLERMWKLVKNYSKERIGDAMPGSRLEYIYHFPFLNKIGVFSIEDKDIGYVWLIENDNLRHYWFAFFETNYFSYGIGKWMMEQMISHAVDENKKYVYLGTCYGEKALYKVRDFKGVEFFDGNQWNKDLAYLKEKCKTDRLRQKDDLKSFPDRFSVF